MSTIDAKGTISPIGEEEEFPLYFSEWLKRRRKQLDLTQAELAERACCSIFTLRKIEAGERRPSKQLAGMLAKALEIPGEDQIRFIKVARGELSVEKLLSLDRPSLAAGKSSPVPENLPRELTPFIGREPELTALNQLLHDPQCSLLTIVGAGGIGKTRLALEAVHHSKDLFTDGTWFVSLASVNSPTLIVPAIAEAVGFKFQDPTDPLAELLRYLRAKRALLVLDNAEHLLEGVGVFTEILKNCQQIKLLVTSRERLNLLSEWVFEIQGLPVPTNDQEKQFDSYSSVALLLQSARRVQAGFEIRDNERQWVLKICQFMEGMPLGIELSAAWVGLLSCEEIAKEIEHNIDFLSVSMRDLPERHRSLVATLDHSWKLLNNEERLILSCLSVFHGNISREAAQTVCEASLVVLSSLKNKTLLYRSDQEYYGLHEIIRQYASRKLAEQPDEEAQIKDRHALYYVRLLYEWEKALKSPRQVETINQMSQIIGNLSHGWRHMITRFRTEVKGMNKVPPDLFHRSLFSLSLFYEERCRSWEAIALFKESVETLKTVKAEFEDSEGLAGYNSILGYITANLGWHLILVLKFEEARGYLEEAIQLLDSNQSRVEKAQILLMMSEIEYLQGQLQKSEALVKQSREIFKEESEDWWYLKSTIELASCDINLGKHGESKELFLEGFRLIQSGDLRLELRLRYGYASLLFIMNDLASAEPLMLENLQLSYQLGNDRLTSYILYDLGRLMLATNRIEQAEEYLQKSIKILEKYGETHEMAMFYLYLGKCFAARADLQAAHDQFWQVIKIGHALDMFYLVYWGLVNIAITFLAGGQTGKALELALILMSCQVEHLRVQEDRDRLLADLQAVFPQGHLESAMKKVDNEISPDMAQASVLAYVLEHKTL